MVFNFIWPNSRLETFPTSWVSVLDYKGLKGEPDFADPSKLMGSI
jgi:hypothetical protein